MKLPKFSTVCCKCDEVVLINASKPIVWCVAIHSHDGYHMIEDLHWDNYCNDCYGLGPLATMRIRANTIPFNQQIVRLGTSLKFLHQDIKYDLFQWVLNHNGIPQF